ncbi:MAG: SAVED domain-containing protein [Dermatophilaceae bacterium]
MTGSTAAITTTNPFGYCFVSYRRTRLAEVGALVRALHELGVPTWQDLHDLDEQPLEATLRTVLADPNIASGVLWITPEVAHSAIITDIEVPGLASRATADATFALVPVAAGGLDYGTAAEAARSSIALVDLRTWNIGKVGGDPATDDDIAGVAQRVLRRRVRAIHSHLPDGDPFVVDVFTRTPAVHHHDAALTIDFTHLFDGRTAKTGTWDTVTASLRTTLQRVASDAPGRSVHLRGLVGLPTAVALGATVSSPSRADAAWLQHTPGRPDSPYTLNAAPVPSSFTVDLVDGNPGAADLAVLVSVSENTVPAFQATHGLGPFRGIVHASAPGGYPHPFDSPGQAVHVAHEVVRAIRLARSRYGTLGAVHLFVAGPAGLAFLIGQLLNTLGLVTTYEHVSASGVGAYARAAVLDPSQ